MNQEWEIGTDNSGKTDRFPTLFWPWEGDRVWMKGKWVYDCQHFKVRKAIPPIYGYNTEIHPPWLTAFTRNEPYKFPGENNPSSATVTYIWIHGRGGPFNTPVGGQNYGFDIPMPPKAFIRPTDQLRSFTWASDGKPAPIVTLKPQSCDFGGTMTPCARVVIPLSGIPASIDLKYGAIVATKWINPILAFQLTESTRTLKVTFDSIKINEDHDPLGSGEWKHLWVGVNGKWRELSGPSGHYGLDSVDNGDVIRFPTPKSVIVTVPENGQLKIQTTGWESDPIDDCFGKVPNPTNIAWCLAPKADNDNIGLIVQRYCSVGQIGCERNFGVGPWTWTPSSIRNPSDGSPDTARDFSLSYRIEQLSRTGPPPTPTPPPPPPPRTPTPPPEDPPICKIRPWLPQCKDLS